MDPREMQIVGICRFSYPAIGGFQVEHDSIAARRAFLYAPARMEERFRLFEALTLPALKDQTDPDFTLLVIIGQDMPAPWRSRLHDLLLDLPQAVVQEHPPMRHRELMRDATASVLRDTGLPSLQFRMDDDDAVAVDFIARLRESVATAPGLFAGRRHAGIDFIQGFIARPDAQGLMIQPIVETLVSAALAVSVAPGLPVSVMSFSHKKIHRRMPVISLPQADMFLRGHSDFNDSRQVGMVRPVALERATPEQEVHILKRFAVSADQIRAGFRRA